MADDGIELRETALAAHLAKYFQRGDCGYVWLLKKRSHTKSRLGCTQCKSRHIKCDEVAPSCTNCIKKGLECDYEVFKPAIENVQLLTPDNFPRKISVGSAKTDSDAPDSKAPVASAFTIVDLGLVHHFTLYTSQTLTVNDSEEYRNIWQHEVPFLAQSYPFLMHAILACAAAHQGALASQKDDLKSYDLARRHYSRALALFRASVDEISAEHADALLCYCILICFLTLHFESEDAQDPVKEFVNFLRVLHTSIGVLRSVQETLSASRIGHLLSHTRKGHTHAIPPHVEASLAHLENLALTYFSSNLESGDLAIAVDAIIKLRRYYTLLDPRPGSWVYILSWPIALGADFSTLLEKHEPIALCILAHWCVPVYNVPAKWFSGDWPQKLMDVIRQRLQDTEYSEGIQWPLSETIDASKDMLKGDQEMSDT